jgi:hypothetical protein
VVEVLEDFEFNRIAQHGRSLLKVIGRSSLVVGQNLTDSPILPERFDEPGIGPTTNFRLKL